MPNGLKRALTEMVAPLLRRPPELQVAALCLRDGADGGKEVLMITSRDTGRWILPKGWLVEDKDAPQSALQEAWEEAGVEPPAEAPVHIGHYHYDKGLDGGYTVPVRVELFRIDVTELADSYPEARERARLWLSPEKAAQRVDEPELAAILRAL
ncbi:NUDIX hydrolase [Roseovarius sp. SCSIO 43702]|uniref:NUDIX hydrolase n=1 Tax=Roseovarius sp. SCSIO 43702 TaxID=2823043 RepID=UPI001C73331B|nr:NUDIX hydrolase [Roseovarius sp. SCSIO 43702]QYX57826.1 NUDIX hydrolase [Roseovarius sp. SCSIO 43702]